MPDQAPDRQLRPSSGNRRQTIVRAAAKTLRAVVRFVRLRYAGVMTAVRVHPDDEEKVQAREAMSALGGIAAITATTAPSVRTRLIANDTEVRVPAHALPAVIAVLAAFAEGDEVAVVRTDTEVSTEDAAEVLNVSRPTVVRWIESGKLPARRAGTHRKILLRDVLSLDEKERVRQEEAIARFLDLGE